LLILLLNPTDEEQIRTYLQAIVTYYETGDHTLFKKYFMDSYQKVIESIVEIEAINDNISRD